MSGRGRGRGKKAAEGRNALVSGNNTTTVSPAAVFEGGGNLGVGVGLGAGGIPLKAIAPAAITMQNDGDSDDDLPTADLPVASTSKATALDLRKPPNKVTSTSVPAFLNKLFSMVNDPASDDLIRWSPDGDSFIVSNVEKFGKDILPRFFKHSNFGSFVRQLNMYGFHKVPHLQNGALKQDEGALEFLEFSNPNFVRGQPDLLCLIRRQKSKPDASESALDLPGLLTDLQAIRKHQSALSADLKELQTSNQALWQEALQSRERYTRQSETINKILRFLASVFGGQVVESTPEFASSATASTSKNDTSQAHVVMPVGKSRLLLEDVQRQRQASKDSQSPPEVIGHTEDDIEEIPLQRETLDAMPLPNLGGSKSGSGGKYMLPSSAASTSRSLSYPSNTISPESRFSTIPSPPVITSQPSGTDSTAAASPKFPSDIMSILSPKSAQAMSAFLTSNPSVDFSSLSANSPSLGALLPLTPGANASSPSSQLASSSTTNANNNNNNSGGEVSIANRIETQNAQIKDLTAEKEAIDRRTTQLEQAIARLMEGLPPETREQLESQEEDLDAPSASLSRGAAGAASASGYPFASGPSPGSTPYEAGGSGVTPAAMKLMGDDEFDVDKYLNDFATHQAAQSSSSSSSTSRQRRYSETQRKSKEGTNDVDSPGFGGEGRFSHVDFDDDGDPADGEAAGTGDDFSRFFGSSGFDNAHPQIDPLDDEDDQDDVGVEEEEEEGSRKSGKKRKSDTFDVEPSLSTTTSNKKAKA